MNPQFCSALPMRPKLVPFVVRPTALVGFGVFDPPSPQYNINIPVVPIHLSCDATLSTATSKTRRELEQLGSPNEKWTNMIFEPAAQKNGIRIGTVSSKGGMVKQGNSLEDFKKIAERNGITVCQEGSQKAAGSVIIESDVSPVCITAPHQGLSTSLSSVANGDKSSWSEEPVDKQQNASEPQGSAALFEPEVEAEMNESKLTITDVCKDKATKSGTSVQDISGSEGNQTEQCSNLSGDCGMATKGGKCGLSGEDMVCEPETVPAAITSSEESVVVDATGKLECNDTIPDPVHETKSGDEKTVTVETGVVEMTANYSSQISDLKESAENDRSSEMCINVTSRESISGAEDVSVATNSSLEDVQIKAFENIVAVVVDCHSQTCEEDCGISRRAAEVQVSATKEAFEEECLLWKLDDNATGNETELCFKDLYFDERKAREELSASLQNEKDVSANVRHNHKRVMDELKEVLATEIEECEKLKKDLKALKKQKESEIQRISKESKSKEEELHTAKSTLQVKDAALEALRVVASEQTAQIKQLEEQLEEMKSALSDAHSREDCKTCLKSNMESNEVSKATGQDGQSGDGWTVYTGKKSKSPNYKLTKHNRLESGGIDQLCDIDVDAPPCAQWQSSGRKKSSDCEMQSCGLRDVSCSSGSQGFQGNESVKSKADAVVTVPDVEQEAQCKPITQDKLIENNVDGKAPVQSHQQNADSVANANDNAQKPLVGEGLTTQPPSHLVNPATFPGQPFLFPTIPPEVLAKYLSSQMQMLQQIRPPGNGTLPKSSGPVRPPPGLNTEPVPEADVPDHSSPPPPTSTGKLCSFDRLMASLQKRFPSKNRQELIVCLRKAKAGCGAAGFRGMQIPDVVKCVESMVELEQRQASEDNQTPSAL